MHINLTLIGQMLSFVVFVWFTMKFVWPRELCTNGLCFAGPQYKGSVFFTIEVVPVCRITGQSDRQELNRFANRSRQLFQAAFT